MDDPEFPLEPLGPKTQDLEIFWTHWHEKGWNEGRIEGLNEARRAGRLEVVSAIVVRQLRHRFGSQIEDFIPRIQRLSEQQLNDLGIALLDLQDFAQLALWLEQEKV